LFFLNKKSRLKINHLTKEVYVSQLKVSIQFNYNNF
jgi:hypothetical protein